MGFRSFLQVLLGNREPTLLASLQTASPSNSASTTILIFLAQATAHIKCFKLLFLLQLHFSTARWHRKLCFYMWWESGISTFLSKIFPVYGPQCAAQCLLWGPLCLTKKLKKGCLLWVVNSIKQCCPYCASKERGRVQLRGCCTTFYSPTQENQ